MNAIPLLPGLRIEQTLELVTDAGERTVIARSVGRQIVLPTARGVCESVPGGSSLSVWTGPSRPADPWASPGVPLDVGSGFIAVGGVFNNTGAFSEIKLFNSSGEGMSLLTGFGDPVPVDAGVVAQNGGQTITDVIAREITAVAMLLTSAGLRVYIGTVDGIFTGIAVVSNPFTALTSTVSAAYYGTYEWWTGSIGPDTSSNIVRDWVIANSGA